MSGHSSSGTSRGAMAPARALATWLRAPRFARNAAISLPTFLIDLGLLYVLVHRAHLQYLLATIVAFAVANGLGYFLARWLVFEGTKRGVRAGLVWFLAIAALSALAVVVLMWALVSLMHVEVIVSRIISASLVGVGGYVLNLVFNFRVASAADPARRRHASRRASWTIVKDKKAE